MPHPNLVPVKPMLSRSTQSSGVSESTSTVWTRPFTFTSNFATVPPRVDYKLTALGESLGEAVCGVWMWVGKHVSEVERARRAYDRKNGRTERVRTVVVQRPSL